MGSWFKPWGISAGLTRPGAFALPMRGAGRLDFTSTHPILAKHGSRPFRGDRGARLAHALPQSLYHPRGRLACDGRDRHSGSLQHPARSGRRLALDSGAGRHRPARPPALGGRCGGSGGRRRHRRAVASGWCTLRWRLLVLVSTASARPAPARFSTPLPFPPGATHRPVLLEEASPCVSPRFPCLRLQPR